MVRRVRPAVVKISSNGDAFANGSGVIYRTDSRNRAYILTNYHVVDEAPQLWVQVGDAEWFTPEVLRIDPRRDLAVLRICCGAFTSVGFADSDTLFAGDDVIAIGYQLDRHMPRRRVIVPGEASVTKGHHIGLQVQHPQGRCSFRTTRRSTPAAAGAPCSHPRARSWASNTFFLASLSGPALENLAFAVLETTIQDRLRLWAGDPADSFGPLSGALRHELDGRNERWSPVFEATEDEFVLSATFVNPYGAADHHWDYGFQFGITDDPGDQFLSVVVRSDELWRVLLYAADGSVDDLAVWKHPLVTARLGAGEPPGAPRRRVLWVALRQ